MQSDHFRYVASVVLITLSVALAVAVVTLVYILLARPEPFFIAFSNFLFLAGMAVLTIGALFEFFMRNRSHALGKSLLAPVDYLFKSAAIAEADKEKAKRSESETSMGWILIYAGALAIIISLVSALIGMK